MRTSRETGSPSLLIFFSPADNGGNGSLALLKVILLYPFMSDESMLFIMDVRINSDDAGDGLIASPLTSSLHDRLALITYDR